jgi:hypothetical protein
MSHAGPDDVVLVTKWTTPSFALYADTPVDLRPTPEQSVGFVPTFSDGRLHPFLLTTTSEEFEDHVNGARRVHVLHANLNGPAQKRLVFEVAVGLSLRGFEHESTTTVGTGTIDVWHRATA